jgi:hypothetical protein
MDSRGGGRVHHLLETSFLSIRAEGSTTESTQTSFSQTRAAASIRPCGMIGDTRGVEMRSSKKGL